MTTINYEDFARAIGQAWYGMHECVSFNMTGDYHDFNDRYFTLIKALLMLTGFEADVYLSYATNKCIVTINDHKYTFEINDLL